MAERSLKRHGFPDLRREIRFRSARSDPGWIIYEFLRC